MAELVHEVTIVIVTHNMQQAARVSQQSAFFFAELDAPGVIVEAGLHDGFPFAGGLHAPPTTSTAASAVP